MGSEVLAADQMGSLRLILYLCLVSLALTARGRPGSCETSRCRASSVTATACCISGRNSRCCSYSGWNNNKPGSCPPYHGRRRRSPEEAPWRHGGSGFNPGHHQDHGRCIRDSECPGSLKCCYLTSGYQCTQPQYWG